MDPGATKIIRHDVLIPDWVVLSPIIAIAAILRIAFWNGPLGSDDTVYLGRSIEIANGVWTTASYNGALRYAFNIPAGLLIRLLGVSEISVNLWPFLCSLAEIFLVYVWARAFWGQRAAAIAAIVLACIPLHIASATRIHADPVVSLFLTLSFVLFCFAEERQKTLLYWFAGLAMGAVFWTKELASVVLLSFAFYPIFARRLDWRWVYVVLGGLVMLGTHLLLMWEIAGDPLHLFKIVLTATNRNFIQGGQGEDNPWFYLRYLLIDIKHTWIVGHLAAIGLFALVLHRHRTSQAGWISNYVIFWLLALVGILSLFPVSLSPLRFAMKQSNYLTLFLAPLALVASGLIARLPNFYAISTLIVVAIGGIVLGALEQQAYRLFTSNSKAVVEFARLHPQSIIYGSVNNANIAYFEARMTGVRDLEERVRKVSRTAPTSYESEQFGASGTFAAIDRETMGWGTDAIIFESAPVCWTPMQVLAPTGFGLGREVAIGLLRGASLLFGPADRPMVAIKRLIDPLPATVYRIEAADFWCHGRDK